ncbi:hypothetical protein GCM10011491_35970 [Brucella endophytica]|uniref:Uncharacterized protein n=1 Tax=Brucella endophytica TaxID=1963359 RepID=A0A916SL98_9HYPH|nr:hypothetical protein [Brucella endophytica]GGB04684.1 hypothetical protein GCM10011491_35970 [Brucella endophytica]
MNFINDRELARRFKSDSVPSKERFWYYFIYTVVLSATLSSYIITEFYEYDPNHWHYLTDIAAVLINMIGISICYRTNKAGDDKEFIERIVCIGFPVLVQVIIMFIVIEALLMTIRSFLDPEDNFTNLPLFYFFDTCFLYGYFYWRLNSSIRIAAS